MTEQLERRAAALVASYGMTLDHARRYVADLIAAEAAEADRRSAHQVVVAAELALRDVTCASRNDDGYPCSNPPGSHWSSSMCERCGDRWRDNCRASATTSSLGLIPAMFAAGDLVIRPRRRNARNEVARVAEIRWVPEVDWEDRDRGPDGKAKTPHPVYLALEYSGEPRPIHYRIPGGYAKHWTVVGPHHAICAACRQPWPCDHTRQEQAIREFARKLEETCRHCGQSVQGCSYTTMSSPDLDTGQPGTIWFHTRKRGGCRQAAINYETRLLEAGRIRRRTVT